MHRLSDFCSLYGTYFGNMRMTRTRAWFVWDASKLHEDAMSRMYPGKDRQIERAYMNKGSFTKTVCRCVAHLPHRRDHCLLYGLHTYGSATVEYRLVERPLRLKVVLASEY